MFPAPGEYEAATTELAMTLSAFTTPENVHWDASMRTSVGLGPVARTPTT